MHFYKITINYTIIKFKYFVNIHFPANDDGLSIESLN